MLYDVNLGVRDYFTYTDAMLNNSLFSLYLKKNGLNIYCPKDGIENSKNESTRDVICLDFDFGSRSYNDEITRMYKLLGCSKSNDLQSKIFDAIKKVEDNKELYSEKKRGEIRTLYYNEGVSITYKSKNKDNLITIHYKMLFRTSAKAKLGQVIFINSELYPKAYDWLTMGLGEKMPEENAKIVELSAYAPLTTSTIVGTMNIPVEDILILEDQDSFFKTCAKIVEAKTYSNDQKKCVVKSQTIEVKNTIWDGMGVIESSYLPKWVNGMALMRNHFFKMCGLRGHIQMFFQDWCEENGHDYETYKIKDMFGKWHYLKDIKMITTDNAIKWKKFVDLMGGSLESAHSYWCDRIRADGNVWGIVKTDHPSKLGKYQQLSYQMINTLPCEKKDVEEIAKTSVEYVELLKKDNDAFEKFLRKNANEINHYEMLADLYDHNHEFANSKWFRYEKKEIIKTYVRRLRKGKILVNGDNLTVFGNPYGLLLYSVGEDWKNDTTLKKEENCIQCYTNRFDDGEYLAAFRNPHNSPNNVCYMHNVYSEELKTYFEFSPNIVAINCIETDIQHRANGMDEDSDFMLFTNNESIVKCAKKCYEDYPTVVNALKESGITYSNTMDDYANMDNKFSSSKMGIGWSSNLAQLGITYYWTEKSKEKPNTSKLNELYDNFIILSVLAQVIIDGCKREYEINGEEEIKRISKLPCMTIYRTESKSDKLAEKQKKQKHDFPLFMKYTKEIKHTKNGKEIPHEQVEKQMNKLKNRINHDLICPMNWLEECLDKIQGSSTAATIPTSEFFIKMSGKPNNRQITKIRSLIEKYDSFTKSIYTSGMDDEEALRKLIDESNTLMNELSKIKIGNIITINRLIETSLGLETYGGKRANKENTRYTRKIMNYLYKMDKEKFLINFKTV